VFCAAGRKRKRDADPRIFHYFTLDCWYCNARERSLGNAKLHTAECIAKPSVAFRCGCCGTCYRDFGTLSKHLNEYGAHLRPAIDADVQPAPVLAPFSLSASSPFSPPTLDDASSSGVHVPLPSGSRVPCQAQSTHAHAVSSPPRSVVRVLPNVAASYPPPSHAHVVAPTLNTNAPAAATTFNTCRPVPAHARNTFAPVAATTMNANAHTSNTYVPYARSYHLACFRPVYGLDPSSSEYVQPTGTVSSRPCAVFRESPNVAHSCPTQTNAAVDSLSDAYAPVADATLDSSSDEYAHSPVSGPCMVFKHSPNVAHSSPSPTNMPIPATTADFSSEKYLHSTLDGSSTSHVPMSPNVATSSSAPFAAITSDHSPINDCSTAHVRLSPNVTSSGPPQTNTSVAAASGDRSSQEYVDVSCAPRVRVSPNVAPSHPPPTNAPISAATMNTSSDECLRSLISFQSFTLAWLLSILLNLPPSVLPARDIVDVSLRRVLVASPHWPESIADGDTMDLRELLLQLQPHLIQHVTGVRRH